MFKIARAAARQILNSTKSIKDLAVSSMTAKPKYRKPSEEQGGAYYYGAACCCFSLGFQEDGVNALKLAVAAPSQKQKIFCKTTKEHEVSINKIANQNQHVNEVHC